VLQLHLQREHFGASGELHEVLAGAFGAGQQAHLGAAPLDAEARHDDATLLETGEALLGDADPRQRSLGRVGVGQGMHGQGVGLVEGALGHQRGLVGEAGEAPGLGGLAAGERGLGRPGPSSRDV
jgi:hypothetical protein